MGAHRYDVRPFNIIKSSKQCPACKNCNKALDYLRSLVRYYKFHESSYATFAALEAVTIYTWFILYIIEKEVFLFQINANRFI